MSNPNENTEIVTPRKAGWGRTLGLAGLVAATGIAGFVAGNGMPDTQVIPDYMAGDEWVYVTDVNEPRLDEVGRVYRFNSGEECTPIKGDEGMSLLKFEGLNTDGSYNTGDLCESYKL